VTVKDWLKELDDKTSGVKNARYTKSWTKRITKVALEPKYLFA
jgi:hypothetical protein